MLCLDFVCSTETIKDAIGDADVIVCCCTVMDNPGVGIIERGAVATAHSVSDIGGGHSSVNALGLAFVSVKGVG